MEAVRFLLAVRGSVHSRGAYKDREEQNKNPEPVFHPRE